MKKELVICTSCKFRDMRNRFKTNKVKIEATVSSNDGTVSTESEFSCVCAKCSNCNKILFTKMSIYNKLKKDALKYFKELYNSEDIKLKAISME